MSDRLFYFTYRDKGFVYSESSNNILEVSQAVSDYFVNGQLANEDPVLKEELNFFTTLPDNYAYLPKEYYFKDPSQQLIEEAILQVRSANQKAFFIIEHDGPLETIGYIRSFSVVENNKIVLAVRQNIKYIHDSDLADSFVSLKIELGYYSDIESFEELIQSSDIKERIFVELRLKSRQEFLRYADLQVPRNFVVSFRMEDHNLRKDVLGFLGGKIENYFENRSSNISNYFDIVRLMRYNFGKQFNRIYDFSNHNQQAEQIQCNHCWARKVCHQTRLFGLFSESPLMTQVNVENCNSIRGFSRDYLKALLLFKELKSKEMLPVFLEKSGFKLKLINP
jgi:hypothetical protein